MENREFPKKIKIRTQNIEGRVLKYYFHLVRDKLTTDVVLITYNLQKELDKLIYECKKPHPEHPQYHKYDNELVLLYMLIGYTRDIYYGKGERELTYMQIWTWYKHFPELAKYALEKCVYFEDNSKSITSNSNLKLPYGSWKDITNMAGYVFKMSRKKKHPLIRHCVKLFVNQLIVDSKHQSHVSLKEKVSLACKWCPRENKKHGWLFKEIAVEYYNKMYPHSQTSCKPVQVKYKYCRKLLAKLNECIGTVETKLCANELSSLVYDEMPVLAMNKYHYALLEKHFDAYKSHILSSPTLKSNGMSYFRIMKSVYHYCDIYSKPQAEPSGRSSLDNKEYLTKKYLQKLWKSFTDTSTCMSNYKTQTIPYCIPVLDLRNFMETHNNMMLLNAIGKAIHLSEVTRKPFRHRILIISSAPEWIDLSKFTYFVDKVQYIFTKNWGYVGNMYKSFELLIKSLKNTNVEKEDTHKLSVVIFGSNNKYELHLDENNRKVFTSSQLSTTSSSVYEQICTLFKSHVYMTPRIVFINENSYASHPIEYNDVNVIAMSSTNNGSFLNEVSLKGKNEKENENENEKENENENENEEEEIFHMETAYVSFEKMIMGSRRYMCLQNKICGDLIL